MNFILYALAAYYGLAIGAISYIAYTDVDTRKDLKSVPWEMVRMVKGESTLISAQGYREPDLYSNALFKSW